MSWTVPVIGPVVGRIGHGKVTNPVEHDLSWGHMRELSSGVDDVERLQQDVVGYLLRSANRDNGLIADSSGRPPPEEAKVA